MKIEITDLTFKCIIGILDFERTKKQKVIINISFEYDFSKDLFIDYSEISTLVKKTMKKQKFLLLEDAILYFESLLQNSYKINKLNIKISKPNILKDCVVSLSN
ncbi:dihydroneopterin aldolase [Arcobacter caeni]|uniref:dihydroneopterin aldolase n=1 Tax=Arcobacter caeni TaxID=1912877 RepID=A0A363D0V6_9BACT|nr:dihydroneopterin aldolase [Arcobacter caeni]PUE64980.1 dihydroneopterin aldolase [Arcobacter caeni]